MKKKNRIESLCLFIDKTVKASGKSGIVAGLSGGVDSAVCMALACKALGPSSCRPIYMPHTGDGTVKADAQILCDHLGVELKVYDLRGLTDSFSKITGAEGPLRLGNFGARMRTAFLYEEAAASDCLVLNTSNKSERMTGYFTKWGDEAGDLSPLGNYYKTEVLLIGEALGVPSPILDSEPSADFYEGQSDEEELGISYAELDGALQFIEKGTGKAEPSTVRKVRGMIKKSGHKRLSPLVAARID